MAAQTVFSVGMFPVGVSLVEDAQNEMPSNMLPAPQLVMLANVAAVTAAEGGGSGDGNAGDEKEMMELTTVGCSYSDSEDENIIRYSFDNQNHREVCIIEYPESPGPSIQAVVVGNSARQEEEEEEEEEDDDKEKDEDLPRRTRPCPPATTKTPEQGIKRKVTPAPATESTKKKKPFHCKPCHFQAQNEQEFVEHLGTHGVSKMIVVNRVEGRSKTRSKEAETPDAQGPSSGEAEGNGEAGTTGDVKGLIRCERCGYNTNRYDHYIAHLKHHSKEGEDHRVFKCTLCPYTTVSQYHWRKHLRNHFPSKLHTCSQCSYFSDRKSNYIQHIRTHTGVRPFQCLYCDYSSSQKTHLTRHMRTHSGERPFKCESCNYLAANQHEVTRHARQVHNGPKPLSCPYCEYKTADRSNFKKHVELHLNPRQFLCPLCKYAASKKCNLQYHIKSRHSGCDVSVDISKVKLRVKRPGPDSPEETPKSNKVDTSSSVEEDFDVDEDDEDEGADSSPINLSIKKSSQLNNNQSVQSGAPEKAAKKANVTADREKLQKVKEKVEPERKVTTRQKKTENPPENCSVKQTQTEPLVPADIKAKRRVKKVPSEKTAATDQEEVTKPGKEQTKTVNLDRQKPEEDRPVRKTSNKEEEKTEKEQENQKRESKSLNTKPRKSTSKKTHKTPEQVREDLQKPDGPEKVQKEKPVKEKPPKRKAVEALDLSKKSSTETPPKSKRLKTTAAERSQVKPASEETMKTRDDTPSSHKSRETSLTKQKKTRSNKRAAGLQQAVGPAKGKETPVHRCSTGAPQESTKVDHQTETATSERVPAGTKTPEPHSSGTPSLEPHPAETKTLKPYPTETKTPKTCPTKTKTPEPHPAGTKVPGPCSTEIKPSESYLAVTQTSKPHPTVTKSPKPIPAETKTCDPRGTSSVQEDKPLPSGPEEMRDKPSEEVQVSAACSSGEDTPSPAQDRPAPVFLKPTSPPPLVLPAQRSRLADPEDDEGIHSSHEGGSDISDSASEGSDDSGLNSTGAGSGKMANDPETPTDEIPTPTELKSHLCIFCDRTFPLEVEYRRHLNRHLVNVYYMDNTTKAQK
ncbi:RE1-silencing transcription factor [Xyrichtys novacula]|uniref:RE1-silencing transcription factor n=1 Tax=Xyrichtys novacula TaxID=13765 RepID=A0AAV1FE78_XYRNO|nr:RE1-silencing transcription factor [Xyrichtys novacula]